MNYIKQNKKIVFFVLIGLVGSILLIVGPLLPWFTFLGGLQVFPGVAGLNGKIFLGSGIVTLGLSSLYLVKKGTIVQWILGCIGFAQFSFSSILLFNLYKTYHQLSSGGMNSMMDAGVGPGLFVTAAGSLLIFCLFFIPMKKSDNVQKSVSLKRNRAMSFSKFLRIRAE